MCLILFSWQSDPERPLIIAANRDEFYHRESARLASWPNSSITAGRDLQAGGTWMGVTRSGRFAAVTNYRRPADMGKTFPRSRGQLCQAFLEDHCSPETFLQKIAHYAMEIGGFNLLVGDHKQLSYASNRFKTQDNRDNYQYQAQLKPGIYGLSNQLLDSPWPKVETGKQSLAEKLQKNCGESELLSILENRDLADDSQLPDTGIGLERERFLAPRFIASDKYGTRASTLLIRYTSGMQTITEQSWQPQGERSVKTHLCLPIDASHKD